MNLSFDKLLVRKGESSTRKPKQPEKRVTGLARGVESLCRGGSGNTTQPSTTIPGTDDSRL